MTKILITGVAGNIGGSLAECIMSNGRFDLTGIDNFLTGSLGKLPSGKHFQFHQMDVNNRSEIEALFREKRYDYVFHYAAVVGVQRTLAHPIQVLNDIQGIRNIMDLSLATGVKRVFYSSSSEVYGEPVEIPQHEWTTPLNSRLPYAIVKNVGEAFLRSYNKEYGLPFTIFRFFNTYGPRQSDDFVIAKFLKNALAGEPITIYGSGDQTRTFCYIDDNIETTMACLENGLCVNDTMNVGSDEEISILDLAKEIIRITGSQSAITFLPPLKDGDMTRRKPDNSKMKSILGRPLTPLQRGIEKILLTLKK
ncbi:MAG: NAD-dependent epimerase/dehydratase family protein [Bacteroidetes bacterium]|nr:NAD-dependent epimerase/dehydratase family protein [Bacteroidota bacterium]